MSYRNEADKQPGSRDTEIARLETDLELARRDAVRYRHMRKGCNKFGDIYCTVHLSGVDYQAYGERLDVAIDAARAGNGESGDAV